MTWAEFQIRAYAYLRIQEREDFRAREIAWASLISFHQDPKRMPKSKDRFWQIGKKHKPVISETRKAAIRRAQKQYLKQKGNGS